MARAQMRARPRLAAARSETEGPRSLWLGAGMRRGASLVASSVDLGVSGRARRGRGSSQVPPSERGTGCAQGRKSGRGRVRSGFRP
jgi:hypothetical protein